MTKAKPNNTEKSLYTNLPVEIFKKLLFYFLGVYAYLFFYDRSQSVRH